MITCRHEISSAQYFTYQHLPQSAINSLGETFQNETNFPVNAYGNYRNWLETDGEKYYICWQRAETCD